MEITYLGHSCFNIKGKDITFGIDPYDPKIGLKEPKMKCDVLMLSHDHFDHNYTTSVLDYKLLIDTPGEYEVAGSFIYGIPTFHDDKQGAERGKNTIFYFDVDGIKLLHLGDLGHELSQESLEKVSDVDVLFIPVGGVYTIGPKRAAKVISSLEPKIVIPMHYQISNLDLDEKLLAIDDFLDEMGDEDSKIVEKLSIKFTDLPEETQIVQMKPTN